MPNMVHELEGTFFVVVHRAVPPTNDEWTAYMKTFRHMDHDKVRQVIFTDGGAPNTAQRQEVNDALNGRTTLCAVVSPSTMVRGVVTALGWFNKKIKTFAPEETHLAFRHLNITSASEVEQAWKIVRRLRAKLGDDTLKSIAAPPAI